MDCEKNQSNGEQKMKENIKFEVYTPPKKISRRRKPVIRIDFRGQVSFNSGFIKEHFTTPPTNFIIYSAKEENILHVGFYFNVPESEKIAKVHKLHATGSKTYIGRKGTVVSFFKNLNISIMSIKGKYDSFKKDGMFVISIDLLEHLRMKQEEQKDKEDDQERVILNQPVEIEKINNGEEEDTQ